VTLPCPWHVTDAALYCKLCYCATNAQEREKELEGMFDAELDRDDKAAMEASAAETGAVPGMPYRPHTITLLLVSVLI
jgi:hypothetical protein